MAQLRLPGGEELELSTTGPTTIGQSDKATLRIEHPEVAELHCVIRGLRGGGFGLKDLGSQHGTQVNGRPIHAVRLHHEDVIQIGDVELVYDSPADVAPSPAEPPAKPPAKQEEPARQEAPKATPQSSRPAPKPTAPAQPPAQPSQASQRPASPPPGHKTKHPTGAAPRRGAHPAKDDPDLPIGKELGGYRLEGTLGHGGMGTVYRATQLSLHREVALKVLKSELCEDPDFVQRFTQEARAAGRFNHPNVVQVFDVGEAEGRHFYSMELLEGGSLEERLREIGKLDLSEALAATIDAARGLEYARELGLVHRDIKPDNLMITSQGSIKICDLGLAGDPSLMAEGRLLGTPHFLSPEQVRKQPADHRSDLYALGCTFYRLLTGKTPFHGKTVRDILRAQLETEPPLLKDVEPDAAMFDGVLARLLAKDPGERFQTGAELAAELEGFYAGKKGPSKLLLVGLAVLVLGLGGGLAFVLSQKDDPTVIVKDDGKSEEMLKQIAERDAEAAYLRVSKELAPLERAAQLESMAEKHADTEFARIASDEAAKLRKDEAARIAAEKEAARQRKERYDALVAKAESAIAAGQLSEAWKLVSESAGSEGSRDAATRSAMQQIETEMLQKLDGRLLRARQELETRIAAGELDAAEQGLSAALALGDTLPGSVQERLKGARTELSELLSAARKARAKRLAAARGEWLEKRVELLVREGGVFEILAGGDFGAAATLLRENAAPVEFEELWAPLNALAEELEAVEAARTGVLSALVGGTFEHGGVTWRIESASWEEFALVSADEASSPRKASRAGEPELFAKALAAQKDGISAEADKMRRRMLALLALAHDLPRARSWAGKDAQVPTPSPYGAALARTADAGSWGGSGASGGEDPLEARMQAAVLLDDMLRGWIDGRLAAASASARRLEELTDARLVRIVLGM
jgi:hypothetical protein